MNSIEMYRYLLDKVKEIKSNNDSKSNKLNKTFMGLIANSRELKEVGKAKSVNGDELELPEDLTSLNKLREEDSTLSNIVDRIIDLFKLKELSIEMSTLKNSSKIVKSMQKYSDLTKVRNLAFEMNK
ncbi:MAG: hypothetical protein NZ519_14175, partial [Bacteroidia bacterium]|nr:hypothetical protein [Bacteroidia bacterium]